MRIRFIREAKLSTITASGPGAIVFEEGSTHDLDEIAARIYLNSGLAVPDGQAADAAPAEPTNADLAARLAELGVDVPKRANKEQLKALLAEAETAPVAADDGSDEDVAGEMPDGSDADEATGDEDVAGDE